MQNEPLEKKLVQKIGQECLQEWLDVLFLHQ